MQIIILFIQILILNMNIYINEKIRNAYEVDFKPNSTP